MDIKHHWWIGLRWDGCKASTYSTNYPWNSLACMDCDSPRMACNISLFDKNNNYSSCPYPWYKLVTICRSKKTACCNSLFLILQNFILRRPERRFRRRFDRQPNRSEHWYSFKKIMWNSFYAVLKGSGWETLLKEDARFSTILKSTEVTALIRKAKGIPQI